MSTMRPRPISALRPLLVSLVLVVLYAPLAHAQAQIKVGDATIRFGILAQAWGDSAQDATTEKYANNLYVRRIRFIVGGQINPNISFFFETDNPNMGKAPKALGTGFITQDAFVEWKPTGSNAFMVDGGLFLPPLCRNCLESAATLVALDYNSFSFVESSATQSVVGRDTGFQVKGYLADNKFEYRAAVLSGIRGSGAKNAFRYTGRISYNVWDTEMGYVYPGMYFGNKRVLQIGAALDHQENYKGYSADAFLSLPMSGALGSHPSSGQVGPPGATPVPAPTPSHDAINTELTLLSFDGGTTFATGTTAIPQQRDGSFLFGYYFAVPKVQPFVRYEKQDYKASANNGKDNQRIQAGLTWYPAGHNFNVKGALSRVNPRVGNATNEYTIQLQYFYY